MHESKRQAGLLHDAEKQTGVVSLVYKALRPIESLHEAKRQTGFLDDLNFRPDCDPLQVIIICFGAPMKRSLAQFL